MQNLHKKLTSKYPRYHTWHQTKHHSTIHWGVLAIFSFFISILLLNPLELNLKKDNNNNSNFLSNIVIQKKEAKAAYVPPPGSPLANKEHPRLFFTANDLSALKDKLKTQYKTEFQLFITTMDIHFNDDIAAKPRLYMTYDAMNYAFLYLVDPISLSSTFTFEHTRDEYGNKAIDHALKIAKNAIDTPFMQDGGWNDSGFSSDKTEINDGPVNMPMALVYDWVYPLLSLQNKQLIADGIIDTYDERYTKEGVYTSSSNTGYSMNGNYGILAIWGDDIDNPESTYYSDKMQTILDSVKHD